MKRLQTPAMQKPHTVAEYYNYYPFGQVAEQSGNYPTSFQWTSKEHDQHGGFDYVYFAARYYDPRVGAFGTVNKAGQFASGYVYGANNPIIGVDRDGNWFGIDDLICASSAYLDTVFVKLRHCLPHGNGFPIFNPSSVYSLSFYSFSLR